MPRSYLHDRELNPALPLVLSSAISVTHLARLAAEECELSNAFVEIDPHRQTAVVCHFNDDLAFKAWLDRSDVHADSGASIGALAQTVNDDVSRQVEDFRCMAKQIAIARQLNVLRAIDIGQCFRSVQDTWVESLGIDLIDRFGRIGAIASHRNYLRRIAEDLDIFAQSHVVAVAGDTIADDFAPTVFDTGQPVRLAVVEVIGSSDHTSNGVFDEARDCAFTSEFDNLLVVKNHGYWLGCGLGITYARCGRLHIGNMWLIIFNYQLPESFAVILSKFSAISVNGVAP